MRSWRAVGLALALFLLLAGAARAQDAPGIEPLERVSLAELGQPETTLRGRLVSTEYSVPGPGELEVGRDNWLDLDYLPSELLTTDSTLTVLWNGVPILDRTIGETPGRARVTARLPADRIDPDTNRLQLRAFLQLHNDGCGNDDNLARHLTLFNTTQVRYSYTDRRPQQRAAQPDLARYPAPFVSAGPRQAPVRLIAPAAPSRAELTAIVRVAAQLGQFAGSRGIQVELAREGDLRPAELAAGHVVLVGRHGTLPSLRLLPEGTLLRAPGDGYLDESGQPVPAGTGIVLETPSPWNPARMALAVTGPDDEAVENAATTLASRTAIRTLRGDFALVPRAAPVESTSHGPAPTLLRDLGRGVDTLTGVGDHSVSFTLDGPGQNGQAATPFDLVTSHSPLLDRARSSFRLVLNGVPLGATSFRDLSPILATTRLELPPTAFKPGLNNVRVEFSLQLPRIDDAQACARVPNEQAWAVLHPDSALRPPASEGAAAEAATLASFPYPFVRQGDLDDVLLVVPDELVHGTALVQFAADLGRSTRAELLRPSATTSAQFDPDRDGAHHDVVLWGLPDENPLLAQLGGRLPIRVDDDRRLVLSRDLTLAVRDATRVGVAQEIASPWAADRAVLVVTGTGQEGLRFAVDALRQGNLTGNALLASRAERQPSRPGQAPAPEPLALGGLRAEPLNVSTYSLRPTILAPSEVAMRRPPYLLIAAGLIGGVAASIAGGLAYVAFTARRVERS